MPERLTVDEIPFRIAKSRNVRLIAYKAFADLAGKGSLFVITIVAAHLLSSRDFGVFALASTLGWIVAVVTDFGIQLHLARAVARRPADAGRLLRVWLRIRLWTAAGALLAVAIGVVATRASVAMAAPILLFTLMYACSSLIEFLHYFYRGLSRSDVESSLTIWQRAATLVCGLLALAWRADVTVLAVAMLVPVAVTLVVSLRIASRLGAANDMVAPAGPRAGPGLATEFRREVLPIGAGIVLSALYFRIDVFLVQFWAGTESVALYNAVFRLVEALRLFPAAVLAVALPSLCRAGDSRALIRVAMPVTLFAGVTAGVVWAAAGWAIPLLYGERYSAAVPAFRILLLSFPLLSLNYAPCRPGG